MATDIDKKDIQPTRRPQPRTSPIVDSFTGDVGFSIEGISDHHMPLKYEGFECVIDLMRIEMINFQNMHIKLIFTINGDLDNLRKLYDEEGWKFRRTDSVIKKYPEFTGQWKFPAPVFGLMLNKYLQVVGATCKVKYRTPPVILDQSADLVTLPDSFPPLVDMPEAENYHYYDKN